MHLHLTRTRGVCSSCHSHELKRRSLSIRCATSPDIAQQTVRRNRSCACTVSCSATQQQYEMGVHQSSIHDSTSASHETDFVVIGSGIGGMLQVKQLSLRSITCLTLFPAAPPRHACAGLCCAAMLARYGYEVTVCESHYALGGAAHSFEVKGHHFDSGPSFFAGLSGKPSRLLQYPSCLELTTPKIILH